MELALGRFEHGRCIMMDLYSGIRSEFIQNVSSDIVQHIVRPRMLEGLAGLRGPLYSM